MKKTTLLLLTALGLGSPFANATPLVTETFSYPDGSLVGNGGWTNHSGTAGDLLVSSGVAVVEHGAPSEDANVSFGVVTSGTLFFGMDFSVSGSVGAVSDAEYFAHFKDDGTDFTSRLSVEGPVSTGDYTMGIGGSADSQAIWGTDLTFGTTYRAIVGFDFGTGVSTLWINPTTSSDTSIAGAPDTVPDLSTFALRQSDSTWNETISVDNLIVGTTFEDVLAIPEPSTTVMLLFGIGLLARYFRKK